MKINVGKFGAFISWLSIISNHKFQQHECDTLYVSIVDLEDNTAPYQPPTSLVSIELVNQLMYLMAEGTRKIEAIKTYRQLTGLVLKESKDAVEKYWVGKINRDDGYISVDKL